MTKTEVLRHASLAMLWLGAGVAHGAEVVWLGRVDPQVQARVAVQAGASGDPLEAIDLRAASTRFTDRDLEVYRALDAALAQARTYETKLDGELVIMRDLMRPIADVRVVRDEADRVRLRAALAYQGFAVNRYFEATLGEDDAAADHRVQLDGRWVERAWVDAVALDPSYAVTAYDIAEAPQRVAYGAVQQRVEAALPGTLVPVGFPEGAELIVGGALTRIGPTGTVKVVPGRHLAHLTLDDRIVARWDLVVEPGSEHQLPVALDDATWSGFLSSLADGGSVPPPVAACVQALGGEVWLARPGDDGEVSVFVVDGSGMTMRATTITSPSDSDGGRDRGGPSLSVALTAGWFASGDFYAQDPANAPHERATVNAIAPALSVGGDVDLGPWFRLGVGVDLAQTLGAHHVALYGAEGSTRLRPHPHLAVGLRWVQLSAGFLFPYHPVAGLRVSTKLVGPLELRALGLAGPGAELARADGGVPYDAQRVTFVAAGVGLRL